MAGAFGPVARLRVDGADDQSAVIPDPPGRARVCELSERWTWSFPHNGPQHGPGCRLHGMLPSMRKHGDLPGKCKAAAPAWWAEIQDRPPGAAQQRAPVRAS
jgi:hypothetical protein